MNLVAKNAVNSFPSARDAPERLAQPPENVVQSFPNPLAVTAEGTLLSGNGGAVLVQPSPPFDEASHRRIMPSSTLAATSEEPFVIMGEVIEPSQPDATVPPATSNDDVDYLEAADPS